MQAIQRRLAFTLGAVALALWLSPAQAQESTVAELRSKGATALTAEELRAFLPGKTLRYENTQNVTQLKLDKDGSLTGSAQYRVGTSRTMQFTGTWTVTDRGRWCGVFRASGGGETKYCRDVLKVGDKHYYAVIGTNEERPAFEMSVRE